MDLYEYFKVTRVEGSDQSVINDPVIREFPLRLIVNGEEMVTLVCSPEHLEELAAGYLFTQGILADREGLSQIRVEGGRVFLTLKEADFNPRRLKHRILTSGCGKSTVFTDLNGQGLKKVREELRLTPETIRAGIKTLKEKSGLFKKTGGVHAALLQQVSGPAAADNAGEGGSSTEVIRIFREDIGRHNAVDKIAGCLLLDDITPGGKTLLVSGRVSAEILLKTVRMKIPVLVSPSAPTDLAVRLAYRLGVTLIGFARGKRLNIYCHEERVICGRL